MRRWVLALCLFGIGLGATPATAVTVLSEKDWQTLKAFARSGSLGSAVGAAVPATCTVGDLFFDTSIPGSARLLICTATNAWVEVLTDASVGVIGWPTDSSEKMVTWANAFVNALAIGDGNDYWVLYRSAIKGLVFACVVGGVEGACNYVRQLQAGKYFEIQNAAGDPIFRVTNDTSAVNYITLDVEATGNAVTLPFRWDLDLCGVSPTDSATSHVWNKDPLSTAPTLTTKLGTNRGTCVATFPDVDGDYGVQITRQIPDGTLTGNLDADIWWDTTGTGNARFQFQVKCYGSNDADDAAFNSASIITAAAGTSGRPNKQTITNITKTGCVGGNMMRIRAFRNRTEASDTLNAALNIEKIVFKGRVVE